jgi:hypothetical protein
MNILLGVLPTSLPEWIRRVILAELCEATADALGCAGPSLSRLPYGAGLQSYALFTMEQADRALRAGYDAAALKTQLYRNATPLGARLRRWLRIHTTAETMRLAQILYRAIGVDMEGDLQGNVTVKRCYFSQIYSGPVCDLISALDDGVFSGLSGGRRLAFSERLTEGRPCCRAILQPAKESDR